MRPTHDYRRFLRLDGRAPRSTRTDAGQFSHGGLGQPPSRELSEAAQPTSLSSSVRPALKWSLVNTGSTKIVGLLSGVILARLLTPHDYGLFADHVHRSEPLEQPQRRRAAGSHRTMAGRDRAHPHRRHGVHLDERCVYGLLFVLAPPICAALGAPEATEMIRVLSLILIFSGFDSVPATVLSRNFRQDRQAIADLASTASVGLTILLAYLGYGAWSFVWGQLAGNLIGTTLIVSFAPVRYWPGFDRAALRQLIPQGLPRGLHDRLDRSYQRRLHKRRAASRPGCAGLLPLRVQHLQLAA